jgi:hypothetical protein
VALGFREPVRYAASSGGTKTIAVLTTGSTVTGALAALEDIDIPLWIKAAIMAVVLVVAVYVVAWVLRAGTTLTADHLRRDDAFSSRSVPWRAIGAIEHSAVYVTGDDYWLTLHSAPDPEAQLRSVITWWEARRGASWRPPSVLPPSPAQVAAQRQIEREDRDRHTMRRWWAVPAGATAILGLPVSLGLASELGFRGPVAGIGGTFVVLGAISIVGKLVSIIREGVAVRAVEVIVAVAVLTAAACGAFALWSAIPGK